MAFARENVDKFAVDSINQTVCVVDSAAPESAQVAFKRLGFTKTFKIAALDIFNS